MTYDLHFQEEQDFGRGPLLWDADPDVCCAAFQLGACEHTEAQAYDPEVDNDWDPEGFEPIAPRWDDDFTVERPEDDEPF